MKFFTISFHKWKTLCTQIFHGRIEIVILAILTILLQSCAFTEPGPNTTTIINSTQISTVTQISDSPKPEIPSPTIINKLEPTILPSSQEQEPESPETDLMRQGAIYGFLDPYGVDEIAIGTYQADLPECGNTWLNNLLEENGEIILTLQYSTPILSEQIEIYTGDLPSGIQRVELLNSNTGLGKILEDTDINFREHSQIEGACTKHLVLPVKTDIEVDTVIIEFDNLSSAA